MFHLSLHLSPQKTQLVSVNLQISNIYVKGMYRWNSVQKVKTSLAGDTMMMRTKFLEMFSRLCAWKWNQNL